MGNSWDLNPLAFEILPCGNECVFGLSPDCVVSDVCKTCASMHTKTDAQKKEDCSDLIFRKRSPERNPGKTLQAKGENQDFIPNRRRSRKEKGRERRERIRRKT